MALKPVTSTGEMWAISCRRLTLNYTEGQRRKGRKEERKEKNTPLVPPVKLLSAEVKTLIKAAAAPERKYHTGG